LARYHPLHFLDFFTHFQWLFAPFNSIPASNSSFFFSQHCITSSYPSVWTLFLVCAITFFICSWSLTFHINHQKQSSANHSTFSVDSKLQFHGLWSGHQFLINFHLIWSSTTLEFRQ
jgi:hypothetical protein